jgi:hypothetical protein
MPAKAGTSGREVSAGLTEIPAFAGMTNFEISVENSLRLHEVIVFKQFQQTPLWRLGDSSKSLLQERTFPIAAYPET